MGTPARDLSGRTAVLTGGTSGIGEAAASALLARGAAVWVIARDPARIAATLGRFRSAGIAERAEFLTADLSRMEEVRRVAGEVLVRCPRLDVLVNNAGAVFARRELTTEGHERTWALNVLAPQLLTELLYDRLAAGGVGRVVNVASEAHRHVHLRLDDLEGAHRYSGFGNYSRAKLAILMLTYETARRARGRGPSVNALHPGFVASRYGHNNPGAFGLGIRFAEALFGISPAHGARTVVYCASAPELAGVSGGYFARSRPRASSPASHDPAVAARLWEAVHAVLGPDPWAQANPGAG